MGDLLGLESNSPAACNIMPLWPHRNLYIHGALNAEIWIGLGGLTVKYAYEQDAELKHYITVTVHWFFVFKIVSSKIDKHQNTDNFSIPSNLNVHIRQYQKYMLKNRFPQQIFIYLWSDFICVTWLFSWKKMKM